MRNFSEVPVGGEFTFNGYVWRKLSTRTAGFANGRPGAGPMGKTWCYFSKNDICDRVPAAVLNVL